jgi:hypothetical protein
MSCKNGESSAKPKSGRFRCKDCGAVVKKKKQVCEPKKIKSKKKG